MKSSSNFSFLHLWKSVENFTNILCKAFFVIILLLKNTNINCKQIKTAENMKKFVHKMLVKLTLRMEKKMREIS